MSVCKIEVHICVNNAEGGAWPGSRAGGIDVMKLSVSILNWVLEKLRDSTTQTGREGFQGGGNEGAELGGHWGCVQGFPLFPSSELRVMLRGAWEIVLPSLRSVLC